VPRVLVVQHAEKRAAPGDPGLSANGAAQAAALAGRLAWCGAVALYASPLRRARETAEPLARRLGLPIRTDDRLRERMTWSGEEPFEEFLAEWDRATRDRTYVPRYGDSSAAAAARFLAFLRDVAVVPGTVVAVTHGGVTVDLLRTLLGDGGVPCVLRAEGMPPAGVTTLRLVGGRWTVESVGVLGEHAVGDAPGLAGSAGR
jgi:broad specificity phosphatase PhoE